MTRPRAQLRDVAPLGRLIAAASAVGALAAAAAIAVRYALRLGFRWLYDAPDVASGLAGSPAWERIVAPTVGGVVAGLLIAILIRRGSPGVADVMEAVALGRGRPRLGAAAAQAAGTVAAQIGGGSIGREGPLIQLGAGVGHELGVRVTRVARERRALVAAGTAAGFAAAYNTPIAAVLFVIEVVVGVASLEVIVPVAVATAIGTALTRAVAGEGPIYGVRNFTVVSPWELVAFAGLGAVAALGGVGFMKLLGAGERLFGHAKRWPRAVRAGLGGLLVGVIAWRLPEIAGNGYEPLQGVLDGSFAIDALLVLGLAKAIATTASVSSGSPGGVFTPTMLIGAVLGGAVGHLTAAIAPFGDHLALGGYALVGVAAATAATTHATLMATVLGFELSGDYAIVLPLLIATAVATLLARALQHDSIYTAELRRRGIPWEGTVAERLARSSRARELMDPDPPWVPASTPLAVALTRLAEGRGRLLYVVDDGPLRAISLTAAKGLWAACMRGEAMPEGATAGSVATAITTVRPDDTLVDVGEKLWNVDWGELPVVDPVATSKPVGIVTRRALLGAFDRELLQRDALTTRIGEGEGADYVELPDGHRVAEVAPTPSMLDQPPDVAALQARFGVVVIAVRRDPGGEAPPRWLDLTPELVLRAGDKLLVVATEEELARLAAGG